MSFGFLGYPFLIAICITITDPIEWTSHGFKHFPQANMSWKSIIKSTKNGPAKYIKDIDI